MFTDLPHWACFACLVMSSRAACPGVAPLQMSWALPHQTLIKKMHYRLASRPIQGRHSLYEKSSFQIGLGLCHVNKTTPALQFPVPDVTLPFHIHPLPSV